MRRDELVVAANLAGHNFAEAKIARGSAAHSLSDPSACVRLCVCKRETPAATPVSTLVDLCTCGDVWVVC